MNRSILYFAKRILAPLGLACAFAGCTFDAAELRARDAGSRDAVIDVVVPPGDDAIPDDHREDAAADSSQIDPDAANDSSGNQSDARSDATGDLFDFRRICFLPTHDDGTGKCVSSGCAIGFHDGGAGACVKNGTCSTNYHDNGVGTCVAQGCAAGYRDRGDGTCVVNTSGCATGYHDGGNGTCVVESACSKGYHHTATGICVANLSCPTDQLADDRGVCVPAAGTKWVKISEARTWSDVTLSADGKRLVGVVNGGYIYVSADFGNIWGSPKPTTGGALAFTGVAGSADGRTLLALVKDGPVYRSTDYGTSWTLVPGSSSLNASWSTPAVSADGTKVVASDGLSVYTSKDSGAAWAKYTMPAVSNGLAMDATGRIIASVGPSSVIYTSTDLGTAWSTISVTSAAGVVAYAAAPLFNSDGSRFSLLTSGSALVTGSAYNFHVYKNKTWSTAAFPESISSTTRMAASADGLKLLAATSGGHLVTSSDGGFTWKARTTTAQKWAAVAMSADGTHMVAAESPGYLYVSEGPAQVGSVVLGD